MKYSPATNQSVPGLVDGSATPCEETTEISVGNDDSVSQNDTDMATSKASLFELPEPKGRNILSHYDYVWFPFPENRAYEVANSRLISRDMANPGIQSQGLQVEDLVNLPPPHCRKPGTYTVYDYKKRIPLGPFDVLRMLGSWLSGRWLCKQTPSVQPLALPSIISRVSGRYHRHVLAPKYDNNARVSKSVEAPNFKLRGGVPSNPSSSRNIGGDRVRSQRLRAPNSPTPLRSSLHTHPHVPSRGSNDEVCRLGTSSSQDIERLFSVFEEGAELDQENERPLHEQNQPRGTTPNNEGERDRASQGHSEIWDERTNTGRAPLGVLREGAPSSVSTSYASASPRQFKCHPCPYFPGEFHHWCKTHKATGACAGLNLTIETVDEIRSGERTPQRNDDIVEGIDTQDENAQDNENATEHQSFERDGGPFTQELRQRVNTPEQRSETERERVSRDDRNSHLPTEQHLDVDDDVAAGRDIRLAHLTEAIQDLRRNIDNFESQAEEINVSGQLLNRVSVAINDARRTANDLDAQVAQARTANIAVVNQVVRAVNTTVDTLVRRLSAYWTQIVETYRDYEDDDKNGNNNDDSIDDDGAALQMQREHATSSHQDGHINNSVHCSLGRESAADHPDPGYSNDDIPVMVDPPPRFVRELHATGDQETSPRTGRRSQRRRMQRGGENSTVIAEVTAPEQSKTTSHRQRKVGVKTGNQTSKKRPSPTHSELESSANEDGSSPSKRRKKGQSAKEVEGQTDKNARSTKATSARSRGWRIEEVSPNTIGLFRVTNTSSVDASQNDRSSSRPASSSAVATETKAKSKSSPKRTRKTAESTKNKKPITTTKTGSTGSKTTKSLKKAATNSAASVDADDEAESNDVRVEIGEPEYYTGDEAEGQEDDQLITIEEPQASSRAAIGRRMNTRARSAGAGTKGGKAQEKANAKGRGKAKQKK